VRSVCNQIAVVTIFVSGKPHAQSDPLSTHGSNCANRALAMGVNVANAAEATLHLLSAIATATLGVDVRNAFRWKRSGAAK